MCPPLFAGTVAVDSPGGSGSVPIRAVTLSARACDTSTRPDTGGLVQVRVHWVGAAALVQGWMATAVTLFFGDPSMIRSL